MPKMVRFREVGEPEILRIEEDTIKQPGKGEVRLKVQAVGLNRAELMFMRDQYVEPAVSLRCFSRRGRFRSNSKTHLRNNGAASP